MSRGWPPFGRNGCFFSNYQLVIVISNIVQSDTESSCRFQSQTKDLATVAGRAVREGGSKGEEDGRRPPALQAGHPPNGRKAVWGVYKGV
jgi:hypothetical protein